MNLHVISEPGAVMHTGQSSLRTAEIDRVNFERFSATMQSPIKALHNTLAKMIEYVAGVYLQHQTVKALSALSDRELKDIGIEPGDLVRFKSLRNGGHSILDTHPRGVA